MSVLIAVPVYNESKTVERVLRKIAEHNRPILAIDDGSTDHTAQILDALRSELDLDVIRHEANQGYGRAIRESFARAHRDRYEWVITMDCDEQHEPERIPDFLRAIEHDTHDIISGSRYMNDDTDTSVAPTDRRAINKALTREINERLGLKLTDTFCGFKAHRVSAMDKLALTDDGYAFPMQLWVQAAAHNLRITELPVELIYNDPNRTFGGGLDDAAVRLAHYRDVLDTELAKHPEALAAAGPSGSGCCCC